jgi:NodT family efflux transporter outer membrane factor (OMF) lipoprotein
MNVPATFASAPSLPQSVTSAPEQAWWKNFNDAELNALIGRAVAANLDLKQADARVRQARATAGVSFAPLLPQSTLTTSANRDRGRFFTGVDANGSPLLRPVNYNDFKFEFDASWELDLWGRVRNGYRATLEDLAAQEQDRRDVLVSLLAEIARNYTELRGTQLRLEIAKKDQADERDIVHLTEVLAKAGLSTERDVAQAKAALAALDATVPTLEASAAVSLHRLSVLTGQPPEALRAELEAAAPLPEAVQAITTGLPSQLLERRPDIRRAEAQVRAADLRIGVAKADYFPRFTLIASGGRDGQQLHDLAFGSTNIFGIGPSVSVPLFNAGSVRSNVELQRGKAAEAESRYRGLVLNALQETEDALSRLARERERLSQLEIEADEQRTALHLSQVQYKAGLVDFTTVLTSERDLHTVEDETAQSRVNVTTDMIALYKALGGGWEIAPAIPLRSR